MEFLVVLVVLAAVAVFVTVPLRRARRISDSEADRVSRAAQEVAELEAARDAKYREIRDVQLDRGTGKLSEADFAELDRALRGEAIAILRSLDRANERLLRRRAEAEAEAAAEEASGREPEPLQVIHEPASADSAKRSRPE
jgi:hypothetical protein